MKYTVRVHDVCSFQTKRSKHPLAYEAGHVSDVHQTILKC